MRWRGRRQSSNIQDVRGRGGGFGGGFPGGLGRGMGRGPVIRRAGGGGIGTLIIVVILMFVFGINPMELLNGGGQISTGPAPTPQTQVQEPGRVTSTSDDEMRDFVATVLAETEDVWNGIFQEIQLDYEEPTLVLFSNQVSSACGIASSASGPFYCPGDRKLYIDLGFYEQLREQFQAPGDFAQAYVIAHEVGHHVQNLIGVLEDFNRRRGSLPEEEANALSVRVELQADCFAGVWGHHSQNRGLIEEGDLEEAINAAAQIGDDTIQRRTQGYVVPESFNHGSAQQRQSWFRRGFESGQMDTCDTFTDRSM